MGEEIKDESNVSPDQLTVSDEIKENDGEKIETDEEEDEEETEE